MWLGGSAEIHAGNDGQWRDPPRSPFLFEGSLTNGNRYPLLHPAPGCFLGFLWFLWFWDPTPRDSSKTNLPDISSLSTYRGRRIPYVPTYQAGVVRYGTVRVVGLVLVHRRGPCQTYLYQRQNARPICTNETRPPGLERSA